MAELSSATESYVVHRAENTDYLDFAIKHLPTPALMRRDHQVSFYNDLASIFIPQKTK